MKFTMPVIKKKTEIKNAKTNSSWLRLLIRSIGLGITIKCYRSALMIALLSKVLSQ